MALIKWYDVATTGDCLDSDTTWNNMVEYIKHSACTDFTIYDTCPNAGQAFRFTKAGTISMVYGSANTGDDLQIYANDTDMQPRICLFGNSDIWLDTQDEVKFKQNNAEFLNFDKAGTYDIIEGRTVGNDLKIVGVEGIHNYFKTGEEFKLFDGTTEAFKFTKTGDDSQIYGGVPSGGDVVIYANSTDAKPYIGLYGNNQIALTAAGNINLETGSANSIDLYEFGIGQYMSLYEDGTDDVVEGKTAGNDLYLKPVGLLKWGTEQTNAGSDRGELIPMKTAVGTTVYLKTYDLV